MHFHIRNFIYIFVIGISANTICCNAKEVFNHNSFTQVLGKYVKNGSVDYKGLKKDQDLLNQYINQLQSVSTEEIKEWNREEKLAYWINSYNAYTIRIILNHYPIKKSSTLKARFYPDNSIKQIPGVWDDIKVKAGEKELSLNEIEHGILRKDFNESRIHFAIVCASIGCPELWNQAYEAEHLEKQLEQAATKFVSDRQKIKVDLSKNTLYLSKILQWFREDFSKYSEDLKYGKNNGVVSFCFKYFPKAVSEQLRREKLKIKWLDYDWSLNGN